MSKFSHARKVAFSVLDKTVLRGVLQYIDHEQSFLMEADKYASFMSCTSCNFLRYLHRIFSRRCMSAEHLHTQPGRPGVDYPVNFSAGCEGVDIFLSKISGKCSLRGNQTAF